jgi:hypothetical protein
MWNKYLVRSSSKCSYSTMIERVTPLKDGNQPAYRGDNGRFFSYGIARSILVLCGMVNRYLKVI